jgi:hypothetical protein
MKLSASVFLLSCLAIHAVYFDLGLPKNGSWWVSVKCLASVLPAYSFVQAHLVLPR